MIRINQRIAIPESDLDFAFTRASGPGGQHVNTSDTAVQLRFDIDACEALPGAVKMRLKQLAGKRLTNEGVLLLTAQEERSRQRNLDQVTRRLQNLVRQAARKPKRRKRTRPTKASKERRLQKKKHRSDLKRMRRSPPTP